MFTLGFTNICLFIRNQNLDKEYRLKGGRTMSLGQWLKAEMYADNIKDVKAPREEQ